jgi:hypothetical protein
MKPRMRRSGLCGGALLMPDCDVANQYFNACDVTEERDYTAAEFYNCISAYTAFSYDFNSILLDHFSRYYEAIRAGEDHLSSMRIFDGSQDLDKEFYNSNDPITNQHVIRSYRLAIYILLKRYMRLEEAVRPSTRITLYHGGNLFNDTMPNVGDSVYTLGFLSTTCREDKAKDFATIHQHGHLYKFLFDIKDIACLSVMECSIYEHEQECIFPIGCQVVVRSVQSTFVNDSISIPVIVCDIIRPNTGEMEILEWYFNSGEFNEYQEMVAAANTMTEVVNNNMQAEPPEVEFIGGRMINGHSTMKHPKIFTSMPIAQTSQLNPILTVSRQDYTLLLDTLMNMRNIQVKKGGKGHDNYVYVLKSKRPIIIKNNKDYVNYKGQLIKLSKALALERKQKKEMK